MYVNEIFDSIQGEGAWTGVAMTFLRLQGCNLCCSWCDTPQAIPVGGVAEAKNYSMTMMVAELAPRIPNIICVTGGEPFLQGADLSQLVPLIPNKRWHVETNGTYPCYVPFNWVTVSPKPPRFFIDAQLEQVGDELKFVITSAADLEVALKYDGTGVLINIQPVDNDPVMAQLCVDFLTETKFKSKWRLSYQIHKAIGVK